MARVWEGARVQVSLRENQTEYTGATFQRQYVSTPWFNLWPREESGFAQQDIHAEIMPLGGLFLPLWVRRETCLEAQVTPSHGGTWTRQKLRLGLPPCGRWDKRSDEMRFSLTNG